MAKRARKKQAGSAAAKSRGGHGGARGGAGRPPLLSWEQVGPCLEVVHSLGHQRVRSLPLRVISRMSTVRRKRCLSPILQRAA